MPMVLSENALGSEPGRAESLALAENLARGSGDAEHVLQAARIFALEGQRDRAVETLRKGILADPRHVGLLSFLADLLSRAGSFEEADRYFAQSLEQAPSDGETRYRQGLHFARQGRWTEARGAYEE